MEKKKLISPTENVRSEVTKKCERPTPNCVKRRRPRTKWKDTAKTATERRKLTAEMWNDRKLWRLLRETVNRVAENVA